ncbi:fructosamine-3-kinase-like [Saccostrea echinata]|uniref:fructosamine-3-kinase-like n=1 Tax=Saccostrea echinata TaxID=191078 RepID=UPI002A7F9E5B|nr:fructosamine-3-kinase-like [Saccostrea echinata]
MEAFLREELEDENLKCLGIAGSGYISEGFTYKTGKGELIFVKINRKAEARQMFDGEYRSLECLYAADIVQVPKPIKVINLPERGSALIMEHVQINSLSSQAGKLGESMARLHLLNSEMLEKSKKVEKYVGKANKLTPVIQYGFDTTTCYGYIPMDNTWQDNWPDFYSRKLKQQMDILEDVHRDKEARELWSELQVKLPALFDNLNNIQPALMHGDLWKKNVGENEYGPVVFDPASFYGHSEFDLALTRTFGGFSASFFDNYHRLIPQAPGFRQRADLYELFFYLIHWNHFGMSYRDQSISAFCRLLRIR